MNTHNRFMASIIGMATAYAIAAQAQPAPENIALGKKVLLDKTPNYRWCSDPEDELQITDGRFSSLDDIQEKESTTAIWVQKGTVGWQSTNPAIITIDLGSIQSISGVSYSTAAGTSGVLWPSAIYMAVSNDNKTWQPIGDLVQLSRLNAALPLSSEGYRPFRYTTHNLKEHGRYIAFGTIQSPYTFVDEIEVYKGEHKPLHSSLPTKATFPSIRDYISKMSITSMAQRRLNDDMAAIRKELADSKLSASQKQPFETRLDKQLSAIANLEPLPADFSTKLPLNDTHRQLLALHGELRAAQGQKPLTLWQQHRYAWLPLMARPNNASKPQLSFSMLGNQFRSDSLLLTNSTGQPQTIKLALQTAPTGAKPGWLRVDSVEWTDTLKGTPTASALIPLQAENNTYTVQVPAGMTRKVWFTLDSAKLPPGSYKSQFSVVSGNQRFSVPFSANIARTVMPTPRLSLGVWDYSNSPNPKGFDGITPQNKQAAIALMRSHYVDTPWGTMGALPLPGPDSFDAQGKLKKPLDFSNFDQWVENWKGARQYFVYQAVTDSMAGFKIGTPEFDVRVGSWAKALSHHLKDKGLKPQQLGLLLVDEPGTDAQDIIIAAWAKAINTTAPELTLFSDPVWIRPDQTKIQDAITQVDVLCPPLDLYVGGVEAVRKYYQNLQAQGKQLWFYGTNGPSRLLDPQQYYRFQAWQAFSAGATGQGYWTFGSLAGAPTSWNAYSESNVSYAPIFIDKHTVYNSVHWDAVREGVTDYEELAMLRDSIKASKNATWKTRAQRVLDDAVRAVNSTWTKDYEWAGKSNFAIADDQLKKVRVLLAENR